MSDFDPKRNGGASLWDEPPKKEGSAWHAPPDATPPTIKQPEPLAHHSEAEIKAAMGEFGGVAKDPQLAMMQQMGDMTRAMQAYVAGIKDGTFKGPEDMKALIDREKAKHELADKFEIVGDDHKGPLYHNTLSEDRFREVATLYSDIRMDRSDLKIDDAAYKNGDPEGKRRTMDDIGTILQTAEGRQLIKHLANNTSGNEVDASGQPVHHTTTLSILPEDNSPHTEPLKYEDPNVFPKEDGTAGKGANTNIVYAPGHTALPPGSENAPQWAKQGGRSDVVLFHEMLHGLHQTEGTYGGRTEKNLVPEDEGGRAFTEDEYRAIGLNGKSTVVDDMTMSENAYRDARNHISKKGQRAGDDQFVKRTQYWPEPDHA